MKNLILLFSALVLMSCGNNTKVQTSLKDAYKDNFFMGVAINVDQMPSADTKAKDVVEKQFNSLSPENCMKSMYLQPEEGEFFFEESDQYVKYGEENNMFILAHALVWHSQAPRWLFVDDEGNDVSREVLIARMKSHIYTVAGRYKGRINAWDVVNEALSDNPKEYLRKSKWQQIIGDDFLEFAFKFAQEAAPDAELYYNDYNLNQPAKRAAAVKLIKELQAAGVKVSGIGMQAHYSLETSLDEMEKSIQAFSALGIKVMITELDITVLPFPNKSVTAEVSESYEYQTKFNPYVEGVPDSVEQLQVQKYEDFFTLMLKYEDVITRVTFWGLNDKVTWKNNWPMKGRTAYCLLFDRENNPKKVFYKVLEVGEESKK
jgi:endo-1,4-beta-xylanase